jgi:hypothetical protein
VAKAKGASAVKKGPATRRKHNAPDSPPDPEKENRPVRYMLLNGDLNLKKTLLHVALSSVDFVLLFDAVRRLACLYSVCRGGAGSVQPGQSRENIILCSPQTKVVYSKGGRVFALHLFVHNKFIY